MKPNAADIKAATAFIDGEFAKGRDPEHHAFHRADNIRRAAVHEMVKRTNRAAQSTRQTMREIAA